MKLVERIYGGACFRPQPIVHHEDENLFIMMTPWGKREEGEKAMEYFQALLLQEDLGSEETSLYGSLPTLDFFGNALRTGLIRLNDFLYKEINANAYVLGLEVLVVKQQGPLLIWGSVGQPHVFLKRNLLTYPLTVSQDWSLDFSKHTCLSPLPKRLVGVWPMLQPQIESLRIQSEDQILLACRHQLPMSTFEDMKVPFDIETLTLKLANDHETQPFWLGLLEIGQG